MLKNLYHQVWLPLLICTVTIGLHAESDSEIPPEKMKDFSYALGTTMGQGIKRDGIKLDIESFTTGINDALRDQTKFNEEKIRELMQEFQTVMQAKFQAEQNKKASANADASKKFLEENAKKAGVKTTPSGLQYIIESPGSNLRPTASDVVTVHYRGTFLDGTEFDSSHKRGEPATFPLNGVIAGWTEGLQLIGKGGKIRLFIPPDLAYGAQGMPPVIGPNSTLIFDIELIDITSVPSN